MYLCVDVRNHISVRLKTMNVQIGFGVVWSGQRIHEEVVQVHAEVFDAGLIEGVCSIDNAMGRRTRVPDSAMVSARFTCCTSILFMIWRTLGVRKLCETECSIFPLAKDVGPLSDQSAVMRKDLSGVMPVVETGQGAVEIVVSILNVLGKGGVILYGFSVIA
jgi:hypothetical protein